MNEELRIAINRAKYFGGIVIEYRPSNNSIYRGAMTYTDAKSMEDFRTTMNKIGRQYTYAKVWEEV
jgi:hypothetical protein